LQEFVVLIAMRDVDLKVTVSRGLGFAKRMWENKAAYTGLRPLLRTRVIVGLCRW
jgi:hypothetical protein